MTRFLVNGCNLLLEFHKVPCLGHTENIINILQADLKVVLRWFSNNQIMASAGKLQYMLLGKQKALKIETEGLKLESAKWVKLLGIISYHNLTFDTHVSNICKTTTAKIKCLSRMRNVLDKKLVKLWYNLFI